MTTEEEREDMENIGRAFMQALHHNLPDYSWLQCPSEVIADLINQRDDAQAVNAQLRINIGEQVGYEVESAETMGEIRRENAELREMKWRCFHCDEAFTTEVDARNHFGGSQGSESACLIKAPGEFALLQALRNAEDELTRYRNEDSDVIRAMQHMQSDHAEALRREEEKGYARGLEDAKKYPETLGLARSGRREPDSRGPSA